MTDEELRAAIQQILDDLAELPELMRQPDDEHMVLVPVSILRASLDRI